MAELSDVLDRSFAASERHRVDHPAREGTAASFYVEAFGGYRAVQTGTSGFVDRSELVDRSPDAATMRPWWAALAACGRERPGRLRIDWT